jgi:hypothetical protein
MTRQPCPALRLLRREIVDPVPTEVEVVALMDRYCGKRAVCPYQVECLELYVNRGQEWDWPGDYLGTMGKTLTARAPRAHLRGQSDWLEHKVPGIERVGVVW